MNLKNKKIVHLFHWPSTLEYQESLLKMIALPVGVKAKLTYHERWVNKKFIDEIKNINENGKFEAIFWVLSCKQVEEKNKKIINLFDFVCPVRFIKILNVEKKGDYYYIYFIIKEFLSKFEKIDKKDDLEKFMDIEFDDAKIPYPGKEKGFVHIGPEIKKTTQTLSLEKLYEILENIPCSLGCKDKITIKEYPLVKIEEIENGKINEDGLYELYINQEYKINLSYYQREDYRDRRIYINENEFIGKSATENISIEETKKSEGKINKIVINCNKLKFTIPLYVVVKIPWIKKRFTPFVLTLVLCLGMYILFNMVFLESKYEVQATLIIPFFIIILNTLLGILNK